ncbi:MAG: transporter, ATP-binding protein [Acidobacteriaceae bacterium]|jgi:ABC-2 type transport system ATP-binding protein|nr:transporter, ATP-binding protein [Acidobacteriaceae bacterium]
MTGKETAMVTTAQFLTMHNTPAAGSQHVARMDGVSKNFGQVQALADFNFEVRAGELVALLGPNGAGKTTAIKMLLGLAVPTAGKVTVFGGDPASLATHMRVGAMLQVGRVPETLRVWEHIDLFSSYYPNPLPMTETLAIAGLESLRNRKFGDLSGGQKQRVLFALAICGNPDLLFLDEPTVGLDVEARHLLWNEIRKLLGRGKTVVLTTHYLEEADALADRIGVINKGLIIADGTPAQIKARTAGKKIRCVTRLTAAAIKEMPQVLDVNEDREAIVIHTANAESVLRRLLSLDQEISAVEVTSAGLEEAFLALTRDDSSNN